MYFKEHHSASKKQSYFQNKQYQKLDPTKQDILKKMLYVFTFYGGKVSKYNYRELHQKYFMQLMSDIWTISGKQKYFDRSSLVWRNIQNIYYSKGRRNILDFNQFLQILPTISLHFQPQLERQQSMKAILYYMNAIYQSVVMKQLRQTRLIEQNQYLNENTRQFIMRLLPDLQKLYKLYFSEQLNNKFRQKDYFYKSFQSYLQIMKQFQVYPKLVSVSQLFFIFHETINSQSQLIQQSRYSKQVVQQMGQYFRLSKFVQSFIPISRLSLFKLKQIDDPQVQQWIPRQKQTLKILFQYMETIKTVKKKIRTKYCETRFSLIVYDQYPQEQSTKKFVINQKKIQQSNSKLGFYDLFNKLNI